MAGYLWYDSTLTATIWPLWCSQTTAYSASYGNGNGTWHHWNGVNQTTASMSVVWSTWNGNYYFTNAPRVIEEVPSQETLDRIVREAREREAKAKIALEEARVTREMAENKAKSLLFSLLNGEQRAEYDKSGTFVVTASDGTRYRLKKGWAGNVTELDALGKAIARLCIHLPNRDMPEHDNLVAQKLMLENDIGLFRRTANRTEIATRA